jgi:glycosyltransferase involved in cell wall biosynthesis
MSEKLVSIILPVYNGAEYLSEAIESILNQTYTHFELIIVNDCSTDQSGFIAANYQKKDNRIKVINNQINKKLPASLNIGHRAANGELLTWTSHDNILKPFFLEALVSEFVNPEVFLVYSDFDIIDNEGKIKRINTSKKANQILYGNCVGASFMYRSEVFKRLNGYDESLFLVEDYDFWLRATAFYTLLQLDKNLYQYRLQGQSLTNAIHNDGFISEKHKQALVKMFTQIGKQFNWEPATLNVILAKHLNAEYDISVYFKHRNQIKKDITIFNKFQTANQNGFDGLYLFLRHNLKTGSTKVGLKLFFKILFVEPKIIFKKTYSNKETIKLIYNLIRIKK